MEEEEVGKKYIYVRTFIYICINVYMWLLILNNSI